MGWAAWLWCSSQWYWSTGMYDATEYGGEAGSPSLFLEDGVWS